MLGIRGVGAGVSCGFFPCPWKRMCNGQNNNKKGQLNTFCFLINFFYAVSIRHYPGNGTRAAGQRPSDSMHQDDSVHQELKNKARQDPRDHINCGIAEY